MANSVILGQHAIHNGPIAKLISFCPHGCTYVRPVVSFGPIGGRSMRTLREWRDIRGISYRDLAERAGVARWTVTRIESGRFSRINWSTMQSLVEALGVE